MCCLYSIRRILLQYYYFVIYLGHGIVRRAEHFSSSASCLGRYCASSSIGENNFNCPEKCWCTPAIAMRHSHQCSHQCSHQRSHQRPFIQTATALREGGVALIIKNLTIFAARTPHQGVIQMLKTGVALLCVVISRKYRNDISFSPECCVSC